MAKRRESFFWTSYSDLMTSLFLVMLVLFVLVIVLLHSQVVATQKEIDEIRKVEESTRDLESEYFKYNKKYEKFILKIRCWFPVDEYDINLLEEDTRDSLVKAGKQIVQFLNNHKDNKYLVIIEGQASRNSPSLQWHNYDLSFHRALSLRYFWEKSGEVKFPGNCELQIAGSGDGTLNVDTMRDPIEENNQRFLIYVIPKNIIKDDEQTTPNTDVDTSTKNFPE